MDIFKDKIIQKINNKFPEIDANSLIENQAKQDANYAVVCFKLAKILKNSPINIANDLKDEFDKDEQIHKYFEKIESVNGYLNFYVNKDEYVKYIITNINDILKDKYDFGVGKNVVIDYSSPNVAKEFHIGHLRTTLIGFALYNLYKKAGYNVNSVNHLGDYGTQFGKLIEGYKLFKDEVDFSDPLNALTQVYVKISKLCKEDEEVLERCRYNFKLLEDKDEETLKLYDMFKKISIEEFNKVYDMLGIKFDSWNGESFYVDKMQEVYDILEKNNKLTTSQGACIVDLTDDGIDTPLMLKKSNGTSTYATRDLAAVIYRSRNYDYDKSIYITSNEQNLHFKQVFTVAKYLDLDDKYINGLEHISYGMVLLPTGKMSTRGGNVVRLKDLFLEAISEAKNVIDSKNPNLENKDDVATKVGIGAVIFNDLSTSKNKDEIFNLKDILNFQGETGPYIQYTYVRMKSILEKYKENHNIENINLDPKDIDFSVLTDDASINILSQILDYENIIKQSLEKSEPSIFARYVLNLAKLFSTFYNNNIVIGTDSNIENARIFLINKLANLIDESCNIMGIHMPDKM